MNLKCIDAYTEPSNTYPAYYSLNTGDDGVHRLTVRSPEKGGMMSGTIELTQDQLVDFANKVLNHFKVPR